MGFTPKNAFFERLPIPEGLKAENPGGPGFSSRKNGQVSPNLLLKRHAGVGKKYVPPTTTTNGVMYPS
ncbi:MAG: hypothetical protein LOY03_14870, partial [Cyclobacteriaceae bacterium]|nr:hypothetical protein [Cyclobacteriaceae bacterium]